jgi:hypothetical protein
MDNNNTSPGLNNGNLNKLPIFKNIDYSQGIIAIQVRFPDCF